MKGLRIRLAVFLLSAGVIAVELALMRLFSLRFWSHFASMVIAVALLGFGASGTLISLLRRRILNDRAAWMACVALGFSASVPLCIHFAQRAPMDLFYLAWNPLRECPHILFIELLILVPFLFAGGFIGLALMDKPARMGGHYAANLMGSGAGSILTLLTMYYCSPAEVVMGVAWVAFLASMLVLPWKRKRLALLGVFAFGILTAETAFLSSDGVVSPYKKLSIETQKPGTTIIHQEEGPVGRLDVIEGSAIHDSPPGMSLRNPHEIPPRTLLLADGEQTCIVYDANSLQDWDFLQYTTGAIVYRLLAEPKVLIVTPGGGAALAMACYHGSSEIDVLVSNPQIRSLMCGPLVARGGRIFAGSKAVRVHSLAPRGFLAGEGKSFDLIDVPLLDPGAQSLTGSQLGGESYLFTVESFVYFLQHLEDRGILAVTRYAKTPPREGIRLFDLVVSAARTMGWEPESRLAMVRSWETVTVLASKSPWTDEQLNCIETFCESRGFDLCYLPGLCLEKVNRFHILEQPYYFQAATALLGSKRKELLSGYLFNVRAPTDDRPFFFNFLWWSKIFELRRQARGVMPAFLEFGSLFQAVTVIQTFVLASVLIVLPLAPGIRSVGKSKGKGRIFAYFSLLGLGFMMIEMGFLQKLTLYLSHPIYSAAGVISAFLIFGGWGSWVSSSWRVPS